MRTLKIKFNVGQIQTSKTEEEVVDMLQDLLNQLDEGEDCLEAELSVSEVTH